MGTRKQLFLVISFLYVLQFVSCSYNRHRPHRELNQERLDHFAQSYLNLNLTVRHPGQHHLHHGPSSYLKWNHKESQGQLDDNAADDRSDDVNGIDNQKALDMIQGLNGWKIHRNGIKYTCYTYFLVTCKKMIGHGSWKFLRKSTSVKYVPGRWLLNEHKSKIFCNSPERADCEKKIKKSWTMIKNWKEAPLDKWDEPPSSHGGSISVEDALELIAELVGWTMVVNGLHFYCYSPSVDLCENVISNGHWKRIPDTDIDYVPAPHFSDRGDVKMFCKAGNKSKCNINGDYHWKTVRDWQEPHSTGHSTVEGSVTEEEIIELLDGLIGWKINIHGAQYICYADSVDACKETLADGDWESIRGSLKKHIRNSLFITIGGTNILCNAHTSSKCKIRGKKPWKRVLEPEKQSPDNGLTVQGSISEEEIIDSLDGLGGWKITIHGVQYICYADSVDACKDTVGEGRWKRIPDSQEKHFRNYLFIQKGETNIFCKAHDKSKCKIKGKKPWKTVEGPTPNNGPTVEGSVNEEEIIDSLAGLPGWKIIIHGVQYFCYADSVDACEETVGEGDWKRIPDSQKKHFRDLLFIMIGETNIFCKTHDQSKCKIKGKKPWKTVEGPTPNNGPTVEGSVNEEEIIDSLAGLPGWKIIIHGVQYFCYADSVDACEDTVGEGDWKRIPDSQKKHFRDLLFIMIGETNIFCKAHDQSKCKVKGKKPWKTVEGPTPDNGPTVEGSVNEEEIIDSLAGLPGWKIIIHGVQYFCYADSVDACKETVGVGHWKRILESQEKHFRNYLFIQKGETKIFCKAHDQSKCKIKGKKPWKTVEGPTLNNDPAVEGSINEEEIIDSLAGLPGWKITIHGVQYFCYTDSVDACEENVGEGDWKRIPDSHKKHIRDLLFIMIGDTNIFCKAHDKSKCITKGKKPWKTVEGPTPNDGPTVEGSVNEEEIIDSLAGLPGWKIKIHGVQYFCYADSVDACEETVGEGDWKRIPDSQKKHFRDLLFIMIGETNIFCKAHDKSKCITKGKKPWKTVGGPSPNNGPIVEGSVNEGEIIDSLAGLPGWKIIIHGVQYFCYADSVDACKETVGEGRWKSIPDSQEKHFRNYLFIQKGETKIFCKAHDQSKCKIKGKKPWKTVEGPKPNNGPTVEGSISKKKVENTLEGLECWKIVIDGIQYYCYAPSVETCEVAIGEVDWERIPDSEKVRIIRNSFYTEKDDTKIFFKPRNGSKPKIKGDFPWKEVREPEEPSTDTPHTVDGSIDENEIKDLLAGLSGWKIIIHSVEYFCYADSVDACKEAVGKGRWKRIPDSQEKHFRNSLFIQKGETKIFCKAHDQSKCKIKGRKPWKTVDGPTPNNGPTVEGSISKKKVEYSLEGLDGWKIVIDGIQYYCYAPSVETCEVAIGEVDWERIPDSEKVRIIRNSFYTEKDDTKIFFKPRNGSKPKIKGDFPWKEVREPEEPSTETPHTVDGSINENEIKDLLAGLPGWKIIIHSVEYFCYADSVDACKEAVGKGRWKRIPDSQEKHFRNSLFIQKGETNIFCKAHDQSKCKIKGKKPWQRVVESKGPSPDNAPTVEGSISKKKVENSLDGLDGWNINKKGAQYNCYAPSVEACEVAVGPGDWEDIPASEKKPTPGSLFIVIGDAIIICNARNTLKCNIKGKKPWKNIIESAEPKTDSPLEVDGSVKEEKIKGSLDGLGAWKIIIHGTQYYCYATSVETCEVAIGEVDWQRIPDSEKMHIIRNSLYTEKDGAKIIWNPQNGSKPKIEGDFPWKKIQISVFPTDGGSVDEVEVIYLLAQLHGWRINKKGAQYSCYAPLVEACEVATGDFGWKVIPKSEKKDIRGSLYIEDDEAKIICKAGGPSKCKIKGKKPWKVIGASTEPGSDNPPGADGSVNFEQILYSLAGIHGWRIDKNGIQYICYAASVDACKESIGEGDWESIPDSEKKRIIGNSLHTVNDEANIFCKGDKSTCKVNGNVSWRLVPGLRGTQTMTVEDALGLIKPHMTLWQAKIDGAMYYCYSDSSHSCRMIIGDGLWTRVISHIRNRVPGPWLVRKNGINVFCKPSSGSKCKSKVHQLWTSLPDWLENSTGQSGGLDQWVMDANFSTKVNGILMFCKASSPSGCPSLPKYAEPWKQSTGEGAQLFFNDFSFMNLEKQHKDATCVHHRY